MNTRPAVKLNRNYELSIRNPAGQLITIKRPFSITFNINRNVLSSANTGNFTIYNLSTSTRNLIFKDRYTFRQLWQIQLNAGYGERLETVFQGNIYEALSYKQGTEWVTEIECFDGINAIQNGFSSMTVQQNIPQREVFSDLIGDLPGIIEGAIGNLFNVPNNPSRGKVLMGKTTELLDEESEGSFFIDNEQAYVLGQDETIPNLTVTIDPTQLLGSPRRRETFLDIDMLFFPQARIGIIANLRSLEGIYNGAYKILGINHSVTISGAEGGEARTSLNLYAGEVAFGNV